MPITYNLIASSTLSSSAASVTFSSIPGTYTDLILKLSLRNTANQFYGKITFNGSPTVTQSIISGYGSGVSAYTDSSAYMQISGNNQSASTSNTFGIQNIYIPNYTSAVNKPASLFSVTENNGTTAYIEARAARIANTVAITSMTFASASGDLASGSSFFLYGVKNS
jgi:hypothetical protein